MLHNRTARSACSRTIFITMLFALLPLVAFAEYHPLTTGFESPTYTIGELNGQEGWVTSTTVQVQSQDVYRGAQAVALTSESQAVYSAASNDSIVWIDAYCKAGANDVYPDLPMPAGYTCVLFFHATDGITCLDGNGSGIGTWRATGLHADEWTRVAIRQDYETHKWDLYVNGTKVLENLGNAYNTARFTQFEARVSNGGSMMIDEFNEPVREINLGLSTASAIEADTTITLPVTLSEASRHVITVDYAVTGTVTGEGADYTLADGTLVFEPGVTSHDLILLLHDDLTDEDIETLTVSLSNPSTGTLGTTTQYTHTILDNDLAPTVSFANAAEEGPEAQGEVNLLVRLSNESAKPITVDYAVSGGTASASEYTLTNGTLSFDPGVTTQTILLQVADDSLDEADMSVIVTLSAPVRATLGTVPSVTYMILDDDPTPAVRFSAATAEVTESASSTTVEVLLSAPSALEISVDCLLTTATTGVPNVDFSFTPTTLVFAPGETSKAITVLILGDSLDETDKIVEMVLANALNTTLTAPDSYTITILDDDAPPVAGFAVASAEAFENMPQVLVSVTLSAPSSFPVGVDVLLSGGTATQGADFTLATTGTALSLTFAPGQTEQTILVAIIDDEDEETDETVAFTIAAATNATVGANLAYTYTILNNDNTPVVAVFGTASAAGAESVASVGVPVNLSAASSTATFTVTYEIVAVSTTAQADVDYVLATSTIAFAPGETSHIISLAIVDDNVDEVDEVITLRLVSIDGGASIGVANTFNYTIQDNDNAPGISFDLVESAALEAATTLTLNVSLSHPSAQTVSVEYVTISGTADSGDYLPAQGILEFAPGQTEGSIIIHLLSDTVVEEDETFQVQLSNPENGVLGTVAVHTRTIRNDDRHYIPTLIIR